MTKNESLKTCIRCIMDTTDPEITFDENGVCYHCHFHDSQNKPRWFPNEEGEKKLAEAFEKMRQAGKGKEYDCILGLSGGVDSSYLALTMKDWNIRPLVVHVDAGWNTEIAVHNIESIVKHCGFDLVTVVMDWEEVCDLQVAFLKAGISNQDVVQDHAFFANLYHFAVKNDIRTVISGGNIATEGVWPVAWHHSAMDAINLHSIHKRFGKRKLKQYKTISFWQYFIYYPFIKKMNVFRPLDFMPYDKDQALQRLIDEVGYKPYGRKHGESRFTKFFQNYYLPTRFGYDKRKPHLSSLILSGQMTREKALQEMAKPLYDQDELNDDIEYIAKKLQLSSEELRHLVTAPAPDFYEFKNWNSYYRILVNIKNFIEKVTNRTVKRYG